MHGAMLRLLMILGVLLCSMHLAEPASAHASDRGEAFHLVADPADEDRQEPASQLVHSGHHHCPVAPDVRQPMVEETLFLTRGPLFGASVAQLRSRVLPPLLDPPLA